LKSVYQILKEYRNRQKDPQYAKIKVVNHFSQETTHIEAMNIQVTYSEGKEWLEFDCSANMKKTHCKIWAGQVSEYHEYYNE